MSHLSLLSLLQRFAALVYKTNPTTGTGIYDWTGEYRIPAITKSR
jgi:hypothetical protein